MLRSHCRSDRWNGRMIAAIGRANTGHKQLPVDYLT